MTKGPRRLVLDQYLDSAAPGVLKGAGRDWKNKADDLQDLGDALRQAAQQAELRIGEQTLTGPALRAGMEESSASMITKSERLRAAGEALTQVGQQLADTRDLRDNFEDLGEKPAAYQPPAGTPGVEPTDDEIAAQAVASQTRQGERTAWQNAYEKQEARSLALTKDMDAAFIGAIPPMKDIHGQEDPTEPPPNVPSGPGGTYLPGTQAPSPTGGGSTGGGDDKRGELVQMNPPNHPTHHNPPIDYPPTNPPTNQQPIHTATLTPAATPTTAPTHLPTHIGTEAPTSTVSGSSQNGVTYQPTGSQVSAPTSASGGSSGASAAALGAAGGAGAMAAGAIRSGAAPSAGRSAPVRAIGSTGRAGSAGALSRSGGSAGSSSASRAGSAGSPASRSAGSPSARVASAGSSAARGASTGSSAARGGAGARGAASGSGSGSGSRAGGRGSSGARSAGAGAGAGGSRGGRKGEREQTTDRDSLVYDHDWLGDDDVAPGVLD